MAKRRWDDPMWAGVIMYLLVLMVVLMAMGYPALINYIGNDGIRVRHGKIQTPIVTFHNPSTGNDIIVVGLMHIAIPQYYREIQDFINAHQDYTILREGHSVEDWQSFENGRQLSSNDKASMTHYDRLDEFEDCMRDLLQLQSQYEGIHFESDWQSNDLKPAELLRGVGEYIYPTDTDVKVEQDQGYEIGAYSHQESLMNMPYSDYTQSATDYVDTFYLDARNAAATTKALSCARYHNVLTIWGSAHIPGFKKVFLAQGFVETKRTWYTAYVRQELTGDKKCRSYGP